MSAVLSRQKPVLVGVILAVLIVCCIGGIYWRNRIDWGSIPDYAGFLLALAALLGVSSWRRQLKGTHDFELARRILKALIEMREGVRFVRNPMMFPAEAGDQKNESRRWEELAYEDRWRRVSDADVELNAAMIEAEIVWTNESFSAELQELRRHVGRVNLVTRRFLRDLREGNGSRPAMQKGDEDILYGSDDDEFDLELQSHVRAVENKVRPHLER